MTTEEIVEELLQRFHGWNADGEHGVLRYLNEAHNVLMSMVAQQNLIYDETTGDLPLIVTTATGRSYTMPTNVWRVENILIKVDETIRAQDYDQIRRTAYKNCIMLGGIQYSKVIYVRQWDYRDNNNPCRIMFTVDPGATTDYYYRQSYKRPVQILSQSIEHEVPPPQDINYLIPATAKLIEGTMNGNYDEARRFIYYDMRPKLWQEMNSGVQGDIDDEPVDRGF